MTSPTRLCKWIACCMLSSSPIAGAQSILWHNGDWEGSGSNISSERNTVVTESWAIDDAIFASDVTITGYHWFSILVNGLEPVAVDFIVLDDTFEKIVELRDLPFGREFIRDVGGHPAFRMEIADLDVRLPPGRYYIAGRPVGEGEHQATTLLNRTIRGVTATYFRSSFFGYLDWTPIENIFGTAFDIACTVFGHVVRDEVEAESFTVPLGRLLGGEVADLHESDDRYITIRNRALMAMTLPMIRMEVQGTTAVETASRITVTVETAASNLPNQPLQRLALFDYIAERWITIDERAAPPVDTVVEVIIEDDPTRFIAPGTGQLKMRLDWFDPGATTPWGVRIDHATWTVER